MRYVSTRGRAPVLDFEQAMMTGLARDGGLYLPETIPTFTADQIAALSGLPYEEVALRVVTPFVGDSFSQDELKGAIARAEELKAQTPGAWIPQQFDNPANADARRTAQLVPPNRRMAPASSHRLRGGFSRKGALSKLGVTQSSLRCICMAMPATRDSVEPCNW